MSEGLEALEELKECINLEGALDYTNEERINIIEKELKALEIIIDKRCNFNRLIYDEPSWEEVVENWLEWFDEEPTLEEYNLLMDMIYE